MEIDLSKCPTGIKFKRRDGTEHKDITWWQKAWEDIHLGIDDFDKMQEAELVLRHYERTGQNEMAQKVRKIIEKFNQK
jgi:hypothetical protein